MTAKWFRAGLTTAAGVAVIVATFSMWSLGATARHDVFCQHVATASKLVYGETAIEHGTRQAIAFLQQASGVGLAAYHRVDKQRCLREAGTGSVACSSHDSLVDSHVRAATWGHLGGRPRR